MASMLLLIQKIFMKRFVTHPAKKIHNSIGIIPKKIQNSSKSRFFEKKHFLAQNKPKMAIPVKNQASCRPARAGAHHYFRQTSALTTCLQVRRIMFPHNLQKKLLQHLVNPPSKQLFWGRVCGLYRRISHIILCPKMTCNLFLLCCILYSNFLSPEQPYMKLFDCHKKFVCFGLFFQLLFSCVRSCTSFPFLLSLEYCWCFEYHGKSNTPPGT